MARYMILHCDYGGFEVVDVIDEKRMRSYAKTWDYRLAVVIRDTLERWDQEHVSAGRSGARLAQDKIK